MTTPTWFDPKLSIGNVLTIATLVIAAVAGWFSFEARLSAAAADVTRLEASAAIEMARFDRELEKLEKQQQAFSDQRQEVAVRLARIEERLIAIANALAVKGQ